MAASSCVSCVMMFRVTLWRRIAPHTLAHFSPLPAQCKRYGSGYGCMHCVANGMSEFSAGTEKERGDQKTEERKGEGWIEIEKEVMAI